MTINEQEPNYDQLWSTLCEDEQYAELCEYIKRNMSALRSDLSDFRDAVCNSISEEQRETLDTLMVSICHPPPGCFD
jgi:hypothetical protein